MNQTFWRRGIVALGLAMLSSASTLQASDPLRYAVVDIDRLGSVGLEELKHAIEPSWTVEADKELLVLATEAQLGRSPRPYRLLDVTPDERKLYRIRMAHGDMLAGLEADVLIRGGRQAIVQART